MTWLEAILEAMDRHGGQNIKLQTIYSEVEKSPIVTPKHLEQWKEGGQAKYECWIRRGLTTLVRRGLVIRNSTGIYSLLSD